MAGSRTRRRWLGAIQGCFSLVFFALTAQSARAVYLLAGPVLGNDPRGDFIGGYFAGAARLFFVVELLLLVVSAPLACFLAVRAYRNLRVP